MSSWSLASAAGRAGCAPKRLRNNRRNAKTGRAAARIEVRWLPVEVLRPDERNARLHSARQVARIADSIAAFGFNVPILVDDKVRVLAGHGRVLAARRLGLKEVPTIMLDHLDEAARRAFMIADNRLTELASWDDARLGVELAELKGLDLDFALPATGFELSEIDLRIEATRVVAAVDDRGGVVSDRALQGRAPKGVRKDARPSTDYGARLQGPPVTRPGETWRLGSNRLICAEDVDAAALSALDAAISRWQAATGDSARLPTGETFASVARSRRPMSAAK